MKILCEDKKGENARFKQVIERIEFLYDQLLTINLAKLEENYNVPLRLARTIGDLEMLIEELVRKHSLSRFIARHEVDDKILAFNREIDELYQVLDLEDVTESSSWMRIFAECQQDDYEKILERVSDVHALVAEYKGQRELREAALMLQFAVTGREETKSRHFTPEDAAVMKKTLDAMIVHSNLRLETMPLWYIPSDDVICPEEYFDIGTSGWVHRGSWNKMRVVIKRLLVMNEQVKMTLVKAATVWFGLNHQHVLKMYGASHASTPLFFVCEDASMNGNFARFFSDDVNKRQLWRRFHEAALGLFYLHSQKVVHGDLKCNNLLVGADNKTKICDFGFSSIYDESSLTIRNPRIEAIRWKAPEHLSTDVPSFESDVYSLGMCIIEAVSGKEPWNGLSDDDVWNKLFDDEVHPRPDGFTDKQWELVESMIRIDAQDRISLDDAVRLLEELAVEEEAAEKWRVAADFQPLLEDIVTKRLHDFVLSFSDLENAESQKLVDDICKLEVALEKEAVAKQLWNKLVQIGCICNVCSEINPFDNLFCCDCGSSIGSQWSAERGWHKVAVKEPVDIENAVASLEEFIWQQQTRCHSCGTVISLHQNFCGECGDQPLRLLQANSLTTNKLREEMDKVMQLLVPNDREAEISEPRDKPCSNCGAMNLKEDVFCCDCGNDIEIIKRNKL